eukprot:403350129
MKKSKLLKSDKSSKQSGNLNFSSDKQHYKRMIMEGRDELRKTAHLHYTVHFIPDRKQQKSSLYLMGNHGRIFGMRDDDFNSNDQLLNEIEKRAPNTIILGSMAYTDMEHLKKGDMKYLQKPKIDSVTAEQTLAKKKLSKFYVEDMYQSGRFFLENKEEEPMLDEEDGGPGDIKENDYTVFEADSVLKRKCARPHLSVGKYACTEPNIKLFFGRPNPLLVLEDLAYNMDLQELKDIFLDITQQYHKDALLNHTLPVEHPQDVHHHLKSYTRVKYSNEIYSKELDYQASLLRKCTKLYKENALVITEEFVDVVKERALNPDISEFDEIFTRDFNAENKPPFEEILEKLSILTHLYDREFQLYMINGQGMSLFDKMFNGIYYDEASEYTKQQLLEKYQQINLPYKRILTKVFFDDVDRLRYIPASGRDIIESYEVTMKKIDQKVERKYTFAVNQLRQCQTLNVMMKSLLRQIEININNRIKQGIDQTSVRVGLSQLFQQEQETPENLQLWRELFIEANTQLGYFTLPNDVLEKYKDIVRVTFRNMQKEQLGEDPERHMKRKSVLLESQRELGVATQLEDGSVPSFTQFKAIRDQIVKSNQGKGPTSPLVLAEKEEDTIQQYMRLEQLAKDYPNTRNKVDELQSNLNQDYLPVELRKEKVFITPQGETKTQDELIPNSSVCYSLDGTPMPPELMNKTVKELRQMGFSDVSKINMKFDRHTRDLKPSIDPVERHKLQKAMQEMEEEQKDPSLSFESLSSMNDDEDLDQPRNQSEKQEFDMIKTQRKIDDARVMMYMKALEKGIPLYDDPVYNELLALYPYYQKKLSQKQNQIQKVKLKMEREAKDNKTYKYKFELQLKGGRGNLAPRDDPNIIDVEFNDNSQEKDIEYYNELLKQYERDQQEIQKMNQALSNTQDIFTDETAAKSIKQFEREDILTERRLGNKFLASIEPEEAGSTLAYVNKKMTEKLEIDNFLKSYNDQLEAENMEGGKNDDIGNKSFLNDNDFHGSQILRADVNAQNQSLGRAGIKRYSNSSMTKRTKRANEQ